MERLDEQKIEMLRLWGDGLAEDPRFAIAIYRRKFS